MRISLPLTVLLTWAILTSVARAEIMLAGFEFQDNAFADVLVDSDGVVPRNVSDMPRGNIFGPATTIEQAVTGSDITSGIELLSTAFIELGFTDNTPVNGPGPDLVLFESGVPAAPGEDFFAALTQGGPFVRVDVVRTDFFGPTGFRTNVGLLDLEALGVPTGGSIGSIVLRGDSGPGTFRGSDFLAAGALNQQQTILPEPSGLGAFLVAALVLLSCRRWVAVRRVACIT